MPVPRPSYPMFPAGWFEAEARASGVPADMAKGLGQWMARIMDKQAIDERLNYQWIDDHMGGGGGNPTIETVVSSGNLTLANVAFTDATTAIPGGTWTSPTLDEDQQLVIHGAWWFLAAATGWGTATGYFLKDGATLPGAEPTANLTDDGAAVQGSTLERTYQEVLAAGSSYTFTQRARKNLGGGTVQAIGGVTVMVIILYPPG